MKHILGLLKFGIGGLINFSLKTGLTYFLTEVLSIYYLISYGISLSVVVVFGFFYNVFITYKAKKTKLIFLKFVIFLLLFAGIDALSVKLVTEMFSLHYLISIVAVTVFLLVLKYFVYGKFVFNQKTKHKSQIHGLLSPLLQYLRFKNAKPFFKGSSFLDVGSSLGESIRYLPKGVRYLGVEGNTEYYMNAKKLNPGFDFVNTYLDEEGFDKLPKQKFDTIIALAVIEHMKKPKETLASLNSYLNKGGSIVITTPSDFAEHVLKIGSKFGLFMSEMDEHEDHMSKKKLFRIAREAGYDVKHYSRFEFGLNHLIVLTKK